MKNQTVTISESTDSCDIFCPVHRAMNVIQGKWTLLILRDLLSGKKRFGKLRQSLAGVSPKTLSSRLKELQKAEILVRTVYAEVPPRVEYALTKKGRELGTVIEAMANWGSNWK